MALAGATLTAMVQLSLVCERWPLGRLGRLWSGIAALLRPAAGRALTLALTAVVAVVLYRALAAYADGVRWIRAVPEDWIASASLSFAGAEIILHVGIGLRWPFAATAKRDP